ncbi:DUF1396 domain-containing protein [Streptomyces sp. NPDC059759]|uniref:DUF1396 domain-containing protein n=1 Tax=Streptomyces sp. NPDC059759 TaxID=3346936 RepID=UPI0036610295
MHTSVRRGATGAALAALVLGGGAVACSQGTDQSPEMSPAAAVAKAAKNTDDITSLHYRMSGTVPEEGKVTAEASMSMKPLAMSMKMTAADSGTDGPVEMRLVDGAMYIGGGAQAAKEMDGKSWIKFDMSALGADKGMNADQLGGGEADKNPAAESTFLTGSKNVKKVGTETVEGVKTTHYKGSITLAGLRKTLKGEKKATREQREKSLEQYEKMGVDKFTMDAWIDGGSRTKQFRMRGTADKGPLDMTVTFLDYNKPVTVKAPPAKDTADLAEMIKGAQAG